MSVAELQAEFEPLIRADKQTLFSYLKLKIHYWPYDSFRSQILIVIKVDRCDGDETSGVENLLGAVESQTQARCQCFLK